MKTKALSKKTYELIHNFAEEMAKNGIYVDDISFMEGQNKVSFSKNKNGTFIGSVLFKFCYLDPVTGLPLKQQLIINKGASMPCGGKKKGGKTTKK